MNFNQNKSNFNIYRKSHNNNYINNNINNNNMNDFNNINNSDLIGNNERIQSDQYYCITCNNKYDGIIKCRHDGYQNNI